MNSSDKKNPHVIGLTGGIGTGKSTAAEYLVSKGMIHVDADAISRKITEKKPGVPNPVLEEIGRVFGGAAGKTDADGSGETEAASVSVLRDDGSLDRKVMADIVFHDPAKKKLLEDILFREIIAEIRRQIDAALASAETEADPKEEPEPAAGDHPKAGPKPLVLLDVPLLFESGLASLCGKIILIVAGLNVRIERVMARDDCTAEEVEARIANQMPDEEKIPLADCIVDNSGTHEELQRQLDDVLASIRSDEKS